MIFSFVLVVDKYYHEERTNLKKTPSRLLQSTNVLPAFSLILVTRGLVTIVKMDEDSDLNDILKIENALGGAVGSRENEEYFIRCKYCFQN